MATKKELEEQLNHLGSHLKNLVYHIDEIYARILTETEDAKRNRNYSKKALIRKIKGIVDYSMRWVNVPKKQVYQWNPMELFKDVKWWSEKKKDRFYLSKEDSFQIYPNSSDLEEILKKSNVKKETMLEHTPRLAANDASMDTASPARPDDSASEEFANPAKKSSKGVKKK